MGRLEAVIIHFLRQCCSSWSPLSDPHLPDHEILRRANFPSLQLLCATKRLASCPRICSHPYIAWQFLQDQ
eukprot:73022-Prorocentrum_lima.AAC.1